ncbi:hypothetical protein F7731_23565 [Cytobacillus depressus]|uniref:Uncharacterized protein n=1 Tax=Cytobacillus depressus TaxID=1602942 RepID=A0A6L3UY18_9BACI|nr:hypothetical protein [Cytobacillus depressus]KAB2328934.1 hypothetical protein F7731_23565 [Cytobacillus depressus]
MRIRTLLIHRCSLLTQGQVTGQDPYGRDIIEKVEIVNVPCRFDQIRQRAAANETGTDFLFENIFYFDANPEISLVEEITNVTDKEGNPVLPGSFSVVNIVPVYGIKKLHHYEVAVKRM